MRSVLFMLSALMALSALAADILQLETRTGVRVPVFYKKQGGATATVILLPGGEGSFGKLIDGQPSSKSFLVRSRNLFAEAGLNVAIMSRASDMSSLGYVERVAPAHMEDIKKLVDYLKADTGLPVWLVGTSRGTVSATAAAIVFGNDRLAGLVLTASVVDTRKTGAVQKQDLTAIRIPVLVLHHKQDSCKVCDPHEVPAIVSGLKSSPIKKLIMVNQGDNPTGKSCGNQHYHGFIGMEKTVVGLIAGWIKQPVQ
jgi:pimeloyl-ACP methyl ester carboxylesterase